MILLVIDLSWVKRNLDMESPVQSKPHVKRNHKPFGSLLQTTPI